MPTTNRPHYVVHAPFTLTATGRTYKRGDVLEGVHAAAFESAVASGETNENNATPGATHPHA